MTRSRLAAAALTAALVCAPALVAQPGPAIVGEHVFETFETTHPYTSSGAESVQLTTTETIVFPGATYIAPHFERFQLSPGDYVVVRSPDSKQLWTYRGNGRHDLGIAPGGFYATHIKGDSVVIELFTAGSESSYGYKIDHYGRGYSDDEISLYWDLGLGEKMNLVPPRDLGESVCTADDTEEAKCYEISEPEAYSTARAVARLLQNGSAHCTGWLVGDEGHLMTNEHCVTSQSQMNNIDFEFMAEGASCVTNCASSLACSGTIEASGGTFIKDDAPLDYALLLPDTSTGTGTDLPATYGFMRLRDSGAVLNERIYLVQHPAGWGKRFAMVSTYGEDVGLGGFAYATSLTEAACSAGGPAEVGYWADTQGGSSGSPVLGYSDHRVIALHHCRGSGFCTSGGAGDDRNRGVPIDLIITDLGADLPNGAVCDPPADPTGLTATPNGDNQVDLSWTGVGLPDGSLTYNVYRTIGSCPQTSYELIASGVSGTSYSDTTVSGGTTYSYAVKTFDAGESCESGFSGCDDATATGACTLSPTFAGITSADNDNGSNCSVTVNWDAGVANCGTSTVYNVYRSTTPDFTPDAGNAISTCEAGTSYTDGDVMSGVQYYYQVRAEDDSGNGSGLCAGGNEETNTEEDSATPSGPDQVEFIDDMESGTADWTTSGSGGTDWAHSTAQANSPTTSWFVPDESSNKDRSLEQLSDVSIPAEGGILSFWHRYNTELNWDGGVLEYSTDGGTTWNDILDGDGGGILPNADRFLAGAYSGSLNSSSNAVGGRMAWHGDNSAFEEVQVDLGDFAGSDVRFRWRLGCDGSVGDVGWYVDDVRVVFFFIFTASYVIYTDGFESGDFTAWSSVTP